MKFVPGSAVWLAALCSSRVLGAAWFVAYSAVLPLTQAAWSLSGKEAGMIQAAFHLGYLIAASSAGYAVSLGIAGIALKFTDWRGALGVLATMPVLSWMLGIYLLRQTQNVIHPRPAGEPMLAALSAVAGNREGMLSIAAYSFHNWELLGLWAWMPAFLTAALAMHGTDSATVAATALGLSALTFTANIAGSIVGGQMADRWGRTQTILLWSCVSLALSFTIGWLMALPIALLVALACLYNFAGIADSSTHSTLLAESVPPHYLGVAYSIRSAIGFGAGVVSPVVFGAALDLFAGEPYAWGVAWTTLGLGGLLGPLATWKLHRSRNRASCNLA